MTINVLLDVNIVLDLLLKRGPHFYEKAELFAFLRQNEYPLFFAACALPSLEYIHTKEIKRLVDEGLIKSNMSPRELARRQLSRFLEAIKITPSLGSHWRRISEDHPDREDALISLSSTELPGSTFIWTSDVSFSPAVSEIAFGDYLSLQRYLEDTTKRDIPFVDLAYQQNIIREDLEKGIFRVLKHGNYIMGPEIQALEAKFAAYVGVKHAVSCASGTDALLMALMALNVGPGDAIFTTPFTFIATAEVISLLGATPVFVDIDPGTFNIDPKKLEEAVRAVIANDSSIHPLPFVNSKLKTQNSNIPSPPAGETNTTNPSPPAGETNTTNPSPLGGETNTTNPSPLGGEGKGEGVTLRPRGIIPVDLFGLPADYDPINAIANEHGLFVIEDAAQSFGAEYKGKKTCSLTDIACTSFFPAKPLGCYGDGGMCFTADDHLAEVMQSIRSHGQGNHKYENVRIGINGRLDTLQAAIVLAKFDIFPGEIGLRQKVATKYTELLTQNSKLKT